MRYLIVVLFFLFLGSCEQEKNNSSSIIKKWQGREIMLPNNLQAKILGRDTVCPDLFTKKCKILVHVDSSGCTPCKMHLYQWRKIIESYKDQLDKISFIFIIHALNPKKIDIICEENEFNYPVFYDLSGETNKLNHFSEKIDFQTFLLDNKNRVLLVGSPIDRPKALALYKKAINKCIEDD